MAWLYLVTGHLEKAEARVRRVLESFPNSLQLHFVLGWAAWGQGRTEEAVAAFEKAAALSRDALALSLAQGHGLVPALEPGVDVPEEGSGNNTSAAARMIALTLRNLAVRIGCPPSRGIVPAPGPRECQSSISSLSGRHR